MAAPFKTVLCAVDLSDQSKAALYLAAGLAFEPDATLVVLLVDDRAGADHERDQEACLDLQTFVRTTVPGGAAYRAGVEGIVRSGPVVATILAEANAHNADLIVVGCRGRGGLALALFGSTARDLLRDAEIPVAVVPPANPEILSLTDTEAVLHFGIILVPVDLETSSTRQLDVAARLSAGSDHHLLLMHVIRRGDDPVQATDRLRVLAHGVETKHGWRLLVKEGPVEEEVLSALHHDKIGIAVLGQSRGAPGAVADQLVRHSNAVIVMVP